ncbi:EpsG family protein, partial [Duncaniella freteri]|uniref:EpsG family protein n=1 Tax=Duncaniella freteri TaxID=2530391 RepID=UPI00333AD964
MFPYFCLLIVTSFCAITEPFYKKQKSIKCILLSCFIVLVLFSGLRYDVGMDYLSYKTWFLSGRGFSEQGFILLTRIFRSLGPTIGFNFFVFIIAAVTLYGAYRFIYKYSSAPLLSLFIFFCFGQYFISTLNLIRQELVIYVFLGCLLPLIIERHFIKYTLCIATCSYFFHYTALILIGIYFLDRHFSAIIKLSGIALITISSPIIIYLIDLSVIIALLYFKCFQGKPMTKKDILFENINYINILFGIMIIMFSNTPIIQVISRLSYYTMPIYIIL